MNEPDPGTIFDVSNGSFCHTVSFWRPCRATIRHAWSDTFELSNCELWCSVTVDRLNTLSLELRPDLVVYSSKR
jgi:hypothetical protein